MLILTATQKPQPRPPESDDPDRLLRAEEVAWLISLDRVDTVYEMAREGKIPSIQLPGGRTVRFRRESITEWLSQQERGGSTE